MRAFNNIKFNYNVIKGNHTVNKKTRQIPTLKSVQWK